MRFYLLCEDVTGHVAVDAPAIAKRLVLPKHAKDSGEIAVLINVQRLDAAWAKTDPKLYIGPGGTGASIGQRYRDFGDWLVSRELGEDEPVQQRVQAPEVYVRDDGTVTFTNGRHRFAWLRDHGATKMIVSMPFEAKLNAKRFGLLA